MADANQTKTLYNFVCGDDVTVTVATTDTAADVAVPAGHDIVMFIPRPPNPGETSPDLRVGLAGTAHADNLPISGYFPTVICLAAEGQDVSLSSTAAWSVDVRFGKTESGI